MTRIATSLGHLRDQVNAAWPNRNKASDGWIGDAAHQATASDHNPNAADVVCALDITHDPANGCDSFALADRLLANRHPDLKYLISNRRIAGAWSNWQWENYTGSDPHTNHLHVSVGVGDDGQSVEPYDDANDWSIEGVDTPGKSNEAVAAEVMAGDWGNGDERKTRLQGAGYDYATIQAIVNGQVGISPAAPRASNDVIANQVIAGAWGNGDDRKNRLSGAGYDYNAIQALVNEKLGEGDAEAQHKLGDDQVADQVIAGAWGNGDDRRNKLVAAGYDYNAVQTVVNEKLGANTPERKSDDQVANEVVAGNWGNGQERKDRLVAAGYDYATVQALVNQKLGY